MIQKGLTLIEIIIALGISTIAGVLLLVIIVNSTGLFYKESSKLREGLNINDSLSKVSESIRQASSVAASYTSGSQTYTSGATQLVLRLPSQDLSGNIISNTYDYYVFLSDQKYFRFKIFPDAISSKKAQDQILSVSLDSLKFQYFNSAMPPSEISPAAASKVRITLALKEKSGSKYETAIATSEADLRND